MLSTVKVSNLKDFIDVVFHCGLPLNIRTCQLQQLMQCESSMFKELFHFIVLSKVPYKCIIVA